MTRYEYAAIVYRALQNGAPVDADMGRSLSEFAPEVEKWHLLIGSVWTVFLARIMTGIRQNVYG